MPAVPKTTDADIIDAATTLIAGRGVEALALGDVAAAVGIRAPSLYKRFADRAALLHAVREALLRRLGSALAAGPIPRDPVKRVATIARAYRAFAIANPRLYALVQPTGGGTASAAAREVIAPVIAALAAIVGDTLALPAARTLTAYLHGFCIMEIGGSFQLGGPLDKAFEFGLDTLLRGLGPARR